MDLILLTFTDKWEDWERDGFPSRTAALARALEAHPSVDRMLVVDTPSSFAAALTGGRDASAFSVAEVSEKISVLGHRRLLPRERHHPVALKVNAAMHDAALGSQVRRASGRLGLRRPVAVHAGPLTATLFGRLGEAARVYDAVDDWTVHPAYERNRKQIVAYCERIRDGVDLVTAVSAPLAARFRGGSSHVEVLANAVDATFLRSDAAPVPEDLAALPRPIVGYTGALEERVDVALISCTAHALPQVSFALVGPVSDDGRFDALRRQDNVHFLGAKNHDLLARYIRGFDACMMPHLDTPLTRMMDPIKLHEYIACGRRVVMTSVGDWTHLDGFVCVTHGSAEFEKELRRAVSDAPADPVAARAYARENSWSRRADQFVEALEELAHG